MTPAILIVLLLATLLLLVLTIAAFQESAGFQRQVIDAANVDRSGTGNSLADRLDALLLRTTHGARFAAALAGAGLTRWSPGLVLFALLLTASIVGVIAIPLLGRIGAFIAVVAAIASFGRWLQMRRQARVDRFVAQLPELARLLANSADAGLSVRQGLRLAAQEMREPAASEIAQVAAEVAVGRSLSAAMTGLSDRLPSRELSVLVQTLVIQSRTGGALVSALSGIAGALDERRQLRREIRTATLGASFGGYMVILMGFGSVVLMNVMNPGILDGMLSSLAGQVVVAVALALFAIGYLLMRRLGRVDL